MAKSNKNMDKKNKKSLGSSVAEDIRDKTKTLEDMPNSISNLTGRDKDRLEK